MRLSKKVTLTAVAAVLTLAFAFLVLAEAVYGQPAANVSLSTLENVRAYTPAVTPQGISYAIDQGLLYAGQPGSWQLVETPKDTIVNAVALDENQPDTILIGAANDTVIYVSRNRGDSWQKIPLDSELTSGITALAIDSDNRLIYAGTFNDGVHRLRDVGSSMIASGHLLLDEPVLQIVTDSSGTGMAFVRTEWNLYRSEDFGLRWLAVENLPSPATAVAIANSDPATVYVGTANTGIVKSVDGIVWQPANEGLGYTPGSQLNVSTLATDPLQPNVLYAATNLILGSTNAQITPMGLSMSTDATASWQPYEIDMDVVLTDLMPIAGNTGAVYGLSNQSRTPVALGNVQRPVVVQPAVLGEPDSVSVLKIIAWVLAGLATAALILLVVYDTFKDTQQRKLERSRMALRYVRVRRHG